MSEDNDLGLREGGRRGRLSRRQASREVDHVTGLSIGYGPITPSDIRTVLEADDPEALRTFMNASLLFAHHRAEADYRVDYVYDKWRRALDAYNSQPEFLDAKVAAALELLKV